MSSRYGYYLLSICTLLLLTSAASHALPLATNSPTGTNAPAVAVDPASKLLSEALIKMRVNDVDGALTKLNESIALDSHIPASFLLRASIYYQRKQWAQAEQDFKAASNLNPQNLIKFNLYEVMLLQKKYDAARAGFVTLQGDPDMGDYASYLVFLCDLTAGHDAVARMELEAFDGIDTKPSRYFAHAAWSLVHKNIDDARGWLISASQIYPPNKNGFYSQPLRDLGFLPLPPPLPK